MKSENILVTGTGGFIGFHLSQELMRRGHRVIGVDCFNDYYHPVIKEARSKILKAEKAFTEYRLDICDLQGLDKVFAAEKPDRVCNLAAQAGVRYSISNPHVYERCNMLGFLNVLELVRKYQIPRVVYASSSSVYGNNTKIPFSESDPVDTPISLYAVTKRANELMAYSYSHLYGMQTVGLRFFTAYGPWGRPDMALWLFVENIKAHKPIKVFNHGNMKRDFTYIEDIVNGICGALFADGLEKSEIFNLGNHRSERLLDMIGLIEKELGIEAVKDMYPMQAGDVPESFADVEKARKKLGFEPARSIEYGIPQFIKWYNEHSEITDIVRESRK